MGQYCYFGMVFGILLPLWLVVFSLAHGTIKRRMVIVGAVFAIYGLICTLTFKDYWHPNFVLGFPLLEDIGYGFLFGGLVNGLMPLLLGLKSERAVGKRNYRLVFLYAMISALLFVTVPYVLQLNSIWALIIVPFVVGLIALAVTKEIFLRYVLNAILAMAVTILMYRGAMLFSPTIIQDYFYLDKTSGVLLFGIPLEEYLFAFALGFGCTSAYESASGRRLSAIGA